MNREVSISTHLIDQNRAEIYDWLDANCKGNWWKKEVQLRMPWPFSDDDTRKRKYPEIVTQFQFYNIFVFETDDDAVHFKMVWG